MQQLSGQGWSDRAHGLMRNAPGAVQFALFVAAAFLPLYIGFVIAHLLPGIGTFRSSGLASWMTIALFPVPWFIIGLIVDTIMRVLTAGADRQGPRRWLVPLVEEAFSLVVLLLMAQLVLRSVWGCLAVAVIARALHHMAEPFLDLDD